MHVLLHSLAAGGSSSLTFAARGGIIHEACWAVALDAIGAVGTTSFVLAGWCFISSLHTGVGPVAARVDVCNKTAQHQQQQQQAVSSDQQGILPLQA